jgi:guanylate kinase
VTAPLTIVVSGPGGVGKGTIVDALVARDPGLWLSRSWTTRARRPGEAPDAYVFVSHEDFERRIAAGGFLEYTLFLGNYYGTPTPEPGEGRDLVLEIEVDGAQQVKRLQPDAFLIFVLPPTRAEQERRLRGRGDPDDKVEQRLRKAEEEEPVGRALADVVVVNDDLDRTTDEMLAIIDRERRSRRRRR